MAHDYTALFKSIKWGYFRRLVFGNSLTKHIKLSSFSYSVVIFSSRFPTYRLVFFFMLTLPISHVWLGPLIGETFVFPTQCLQVAINEVYLLFIKNTYELAITTFKTRNKELVNLLYFTLSCDVTKHRYCKRFMTTIIHFAIDLDL